MAKKKKGIFSVLAKIILFFLKGVYGIFLGLYLLFKWIFSFLKERSVEVVKEKKRPKINAKFNALKELENKKGNVEEFSDKVLRSSSSVGLILGARGSGKSATGLRLIENIKTKTDKKVDAMGFKKENIPSWINIVDSLDEVDDNSILLVDEGGIQFGARDAMTNVNKLISNILLVARHRDLSVVFITQSSANLEINAIRQADYLILKKSSLLQRDFERKKIRDIYDSVKEDFEKYKGDKGVSYIYSDAYLGFVNIDLPSFWSEEVSKSFKGFKGKKKE